MPGTTDLSQHLGLLRRGDLHYRCSGHRNSSLIVATVSQLLIYQRVSLCANLLWLDLVASTLAKQVINAAKQTFYYERSLRRAVETVRATGVDERTLNGLLHFAENGGYVDQ